MKTHLRTTLGATATYCGMILRGDNGARLVTVMPADVTCETCRKVHALRYPPALARAERLAFGGKSRAEMFAPATAPDKIDTTGEALNRAVIRVANVVLENAGDICDALRSAAQVPYRDDIVTALSEALDAWRDASEAALAAIAKGGR